MSIWGSWAVLATPLYPWIFWETTHNTHKSKPSNTQCKWEVAPLCFQLLRSLKLKFKNKGIQTQATMKPCKYRNILKIAMSPWCFKTS